VSSPADRAREALERVVDAFGLEADVVVEESDEGLEARLEGEDLGQLIGRHGQTIDAIQHLTYRIAYRGAADRGRLTVDAAGYRERRAAALQREADKAVSDAERLGRPVALEPMSAVERRVVHEYLRDRTGIETYSEGVEPDRHLVVAPLRA
jgi:spoIIIJ-associated protein